MKQIIFITIWAGLGAFVTHQALACSDSYEQSEQYKAAQHANNFLKQAYKDKDDE